MSKIKSIRRRDILARLNQNQAGVLSMRTIVINYFLIRENIEVKPYHLCLILQILTSYLVGIAKLNSRVTLRNQPILKVMKWTQPIKVRKMRPISRVRIPFLREFSVLILRTSSLFQRSRMKARRVMPLVL